MSDRRLLEVSVKASWVAELPDDIDPETDLRTEAEMESVLADEIGVSHRDEIIDWEINCTGEVIEPGDAGDDDDGEDDDDE